MKTLILIPGQKKSGTTSLYNLVFRLLPCLQGVPKESSILTLTPDRFTKFFSKLPSDCIILDATTSYISSEALDPSLKSNISMFDNVLAFVVFRDESVRSVSHYQHSLVFDSIVPGLFRFFSSSDFLNHSSLETIYLRLTSCGVPIIKFLPLSLLSDQFLISVFKDLNLDSLVDTHKQCTSSLPLNVFGSRRKLPLFLERFASSRFYQLFFRRFVPRFVVGGLSCFLGARPKPIILTDIESSQFENLSRSINARNRKFLQSR